MDATEAAIQSIALVKKSFLYAPSSPSYWFCVSDSKNAARRQMAAQLSGMGFLVGWCVKALAESGDNMEKATNWLLANAPKS
jgi:uncharacterized UBP type Zn finger protein